MIQMVAINNRGPYGTGERFWTDTPGKCSMYAVLFTPTLEPAPKPEINILTDEDEAMLIKAEAKAAAKKDKAAKALARKEKRILEGLVKKVTKPAPTTVTKD